MWFAFGETKKKDLLLYMVPNDRCPAILGDNGWNSQVKLELIMYTYYS